MVACISLRQTCWYCLGNKSRISLQRVISTSSRGVTLESNIIRRFLTKGCWLKWWITIRSLLFMRYWHRTSETKQPVMSLDMLWYDTLWVALLRSVQNRYPCWKLSLFLEVEKRWKDKEILACPYKNEIWLISVRDFSVSAELSSLQLDLKGFVFRLNKSTCCGKMCCAVRLILRDCCAIVLQSLPLTLSWQIMFWISLELMFFSVEIKLEAFSCSLTRHLRKLSYFF